MDTSLCDVDVQPTYVRVTLKGKVNTFTFLLVTTVERERQPCCITRLFALFFSFLFFACQLHRNHVWGVGFTYTGQPDRHCSVASLANKKLGSRKLIQSLVRPICWNNVI